MTFATQLAAAFTPIAAVYDGPSVTRALSEAQTFVESYCNRTFDLVTGETVYVSPQRYRSAQLPQYPVVNVTSVQGLLPPTTGSGGLVWTDLPNFRFDADTGLIYDTTGEPGVTWTLCLSWPWLPFSLKVTYDHGYTTVPQALVDVACRLARQFLENPTSQMARKVGDTEDRFAGSKGVVLNQLDEIVLGRYTDVGIG